MDGCCKLPVAAPRATPARRRATRAPRKIATRRMHANTTGTPPTAPARASAGDDYCAARKGKGRTSFLKKRSKKLLSIARSFRSKWVNSVPHETDKSFLVLFFKKERLSYLHASNPPQSSRS